MSISLPYEIQPKASLDREMTQLRTEKTRATNWNFGSDPIQHRSTAQMDYVDPGPTSNTLVKHRNAPYVSKQVEHDWRTTASASYTNPPRTAPAGPTISGRALRTSHFTLGNDRSQISSTHASDYRDHGRADTTSCKPTVAPYRRTPTDLNWVTQSRQTYQPHAVPSIEKKTMQLRASHFNLGNDDPSYQTTQRSDYLSYRSKHDCCPCVL